MQLNQKDQDLLLAAEYGNLLLQQHASMSEELGKCRSELATLRQSAEVLQKQNKSMRKNIKMLETMRKESEMANAAIIVAKDGTDQKLVSEQLHRRNSLDELESLQNRLDTSIHTEKVVVQENRKLQKLMKTLEQQKHAAEKKAKDLEIAHEQDLQQTQRKLARTNNALDKMRRMHKEAEKENSAKAEQLEHSEQFEKELENEFEMELDMMRKENDKLKLELKMYQNKVKHDHVISPRRTIASTTWDSPSVFDEVTSRSHLFDEMNQIHKTSSDVMYEFFNLSVSSVKLKFGVMDAVQGLDAEQLYHKVTQERVPYYQWHDWLVDIVDAWCTVTQFSAPNNITILEDQKEVYREAGRSCTKSKNTAKSKAERAGDGDGSKRKLFGNIHNR